MLESSEMESSSYQLLECVNLQKWSHHHPHQSLCYHTCDQTKSPVSLLTSSLPRESQGFSFLPQFSCKLNAILLEKWRLSVEKNLLQTITNVLERILKFTKEIVSWINMSAPNSSTKEQRDRMIQLSISLHLTSLLSPLLCVVYQHLTH